MLRLTQAQGEVLAKMAEGWRLTGTPATDGGPEVLYWLQHMSSERVLTVWPSTVGGLLRHGMIVVTEQALHTYYRLSARGEAFYAECYHVSK